MTSCTSSSAPVFARTSAWGSSPRRSTTWARSMSRASTPSPANDARPIRTCTPTGWCGPATPRSSTSCTATRATGPATTGHSRSARRAGAGRRVQARPRVHGPRHRRGPSRRHDRRHRPLWPKAQEFGFPDEEAAFALQYGHGVGLSIWEKPIFSRLVSLEHPEVLEEGMVFALETYWPSADGGRGRPHRGGSRRHGGRVRGDHEVPCRGPARGRRKYYTVGGELHTLVTRSRT